MSLSNHIAVATAPGGADACISAGPAVAAAQSGSPDFPQVLLQVLAPPPVTPSGATSPVAPAPDAPLPPATPQPGAGLPPTAPEPSDALPLPPTRPAGSIAPLEPDLAAQSRQERPTPKPLPPARSINLDAPPAPMPPADPAVLDRPAPDSPCPEPAEPDTDQPAHPVEAQQPAPVTPFWPAIPVLNAVPVNLATTASARDSQRSVKGLPPAAHAASRPDRHAVALATVPSLPWADAPHPDPLPGLEAAHAPRNTALGAPFAAALMPEEQTEHSLPAPASPPVDAETVAPGAGRAPATSMPTSSPPVAADAAAPATPPAAAANARLAPGLDPATSALNAPDAPERPATAPHPLSVQGVPPALPAAATFLGDAALSARRPHLEPEEDSSPMPADAGAGPSHARAFDPALPPAIHAEAGAAQMPHRAPGANIGNPHILTATSREANPATPDPDEHAAQIVQAARMHLHSRQAGTIEMQLHPPALGRVQLQVTLREGAVAAYLGTETPAAQQLLTAQAPALHAALREGGVPVHTLQIGLGLDLGSASHSWQEPSGHSPAAPHSEGALPANPRTHPLAPPTLSAAGLDYLA